MKKELAGVIFMALFLIANCVNDNNDVAELKAKMDAMQKHLSKMVAVEKRREAMEKRLSEINAMEERLETLEQQTCKDIFLVNKGKRQIHSLVNFQFFFQISVVFNKR